MNTSSSEIRRWLLRAALVALALPGVVDAQEGLGYGTPDNPGKIDFDRPESWAMKYFTSVSLLTGIGVPGAVGEGSIALGLEGGFIPTLSRAQRTVGFNGTKVEDLNKTSVFGRVRVTMGLTGDAELTLAYVPPVELNGTKPNLFGLAVGVPFHRSRDYRLGFRVYGQMGSISGDFTCDAETVAAGTDPVRNPFGCERLSDDTLSQTYLGIDLGAALEAIGSVEPYVSVGVNRFSTEFETNALTAGTLDDSTFETSGLTVHGTGGILIDVSDRLVVSGELFYTPLAVRRPGAGSASSDGLLNARGMIQIRF